MFLTDNLFINLCNKYLRRTPCFVNLYFHKDKLLNVTTCHIVCKPGIAPASPGPPPGILTIELLAQYKWPGSNRRPRGPKPRTLSTELHLYIKSYYPKLQKGNLKVPKYLKVFNMICNVKLYC